VFPPRALWRTVPASVSVPAVAVAAALVLLAGGAAADWAQLGGLPGLGHARIWSIAMDRAAPANALAATDAGVYMTADAGATWQLTALRGQRVWTVGFDPRGGHVAFAGLDGSGVRRSDDGGRTWKDVSKGLPDRHVRVLALGLGGLAAGTDDGVAVSADGQSWQGAGLSGYSVSALAVSANAPQFTLIAGTDGGPGLASDWYLFRNTGPGPTWEALQQGLPALAVGNGPRTVVSSIAAGPLPQSAQFRPLVVTTSKGTFHSGDGGTTWSSSTLPNPDPTRPVQLALTTAAFSPVDPNLVYAGDDAGGSSGGALLRSLDGGVTFGPAENGLGRGSHAVATIAVAPATPPLVLAGIDPPSSGGLVVGQTDTSVPAPAPIAQEANVPPPASAAPLPTAKPRPVPTSPPAAVDHRTGFRIFVDRVVKWPLPLAAELLVLVAVVYGAVRWRQRRLDVEGPP
jgi:hypothetical protein